MTNQDERRTARVFVSSTFRDMHEERDILVKRVFPELRRRLRGRGVEVFEVDLRWGITEAQAERGETVAALLAEIDRCRPFFVGLLGERYGWVPGDKALPDGLKAQYPTVASGRSVTELEILHGVLSDDRSAANALFFERDRSWSEEQPGPDFVEASEEGRRKLAALKDRLRDKGARLIHYADPEALGGLALEALADRLETWFPASENLDPRAQVTLLHAAYARERRGLHIGAERYLEALDRWLSDPEAGSLVVTGASGGGKSTLLANWLAAQRTADPRLLIFEHYLGASPDSADPVQLMRRWSAFLQAEMGDETPLTASDDLIKVADDLQRQLSAASAWAQEHDRTWLVALDGLDKLDPAVSLRWLPDPLPANVRLVGSSLPGAALEAATSRQWRSLEVVPLNEAERHAFVDGNLDQWGRDLSDRHVAALLAHPLAGTPLFLKTVLDELRLSAIHDRLDDRLDYYLASSSMPDLFARMLARLEEDADDPAVVRRSLTLVWASRAGLEEAEILRIADVTPLAWSQLRNGLGDALRDQAGRLTFNHDFLRSAVEHRYVADSAAQRQAHRTLADAFQATEARARQAEELPFQLRAAQAWSDLETYLLNLDRLGLNRQRGDAELLGYWLPLVQQGRDLEALLCSQFDAHVGPPDYWTDDDLRIAFALGEFLHFAGRTGEAHKRLSERRWTASEARWGPEHEATLRSRNDLAALLKAQGDWQGARVHESWVLETRERLLGPDHPYTILSRNNLAATMESQGDFAAAIAHHQRAAEASVRVQGPEHRDTLTYFDNLATALHSAGELDQAQAVAEDVLKKRTRVLGPAHSDTVRTMNNLALTLVRQGDLDNAQAYQERAVQVSAEVLGPDHPQTLTSRSNLAGTLQERGDFNGALSLEQQVLQARQRQLGEHHPDTLRSMADVATVHAAQGDLEPARLMYERVLAGREAALGPDHPDTLAAVNNLAGIVRDLGHLERAQGLQEELLDRVQRILGPEHPDTVRALQNVAGIRLMRGEVAAAQTAAQRAYDLFDARFGLEHPDTLMASNLLASVHYAQDELAKAEALLTPAIDASQRLLGADHPETLTRTNTLAAVRMKQGDLDGARALLDRVVKGRLQLLGPDPPRHLDREVEPRPSVAKSRRPFGRANAGRRSPRRGDGATGGRPPIDLGHQKQSRPHALGPGARRTGRADASRSTRCAPPRTRFRASVDATGDDQPGRDLGSTGPARPGRNAAGRGR